MEITVRKYVRGSFVETYEQTITVPDNISQEQIDEEVDLTDGEAVVEWLESNNLLNDDWGDSIHFDDSDDSVEYEVENVSGDYSED